MISITSKTKKKVEQVFRWRVSHVSLREIRLWEDKYCDVKPLVFFDKIYLYTPNGHQDKIQDLKSVMDRMSEKVGNDVIEIKGQDDIVDTSDYEDIIIPPPLEFRDRYKSTPMLTTKKDDYASSNAKDKNRGGK